MIDWVFFDVGNVLFNDDPQNFYSYRRMFDVIREHHPGYTFEEMLAERESLARAGSTWNLHKIAKRFLSPEIVAGELDRLRTTLIGDYDANHLVNADARETLDALALRYRLGIIANQPPECRASLRRRDFLDLFSVVGISEELDLHKPDIKFFEWAIAASGCDPRRAVMIGDRIDNDVAPAKDVGMRTILVRWPHSGDKGWRPADSYGSGFLESCDRIPLFSAADISPRPDRIVTSLREIPAAITSLTGEIGERGA